MRHPSLVPTDLGPLSGVEAFALIQMLEHDGIVVLRKLFKRRHDDALGNLRGINFPSEQAMFERGALDALASVDEILLALRKNYDDAATKESIDDGTQDARSDLAHAPADEPGPG